jgi:hypothetical protein
MNQRGKRHGTTPEILLGAYIAIASGDAQLFITTTKQWDATTPPRERRWKNFTQDFQIEFPRNSGQPAC